MKKSILAVAGLAAVAGIAAVPMASIQAADVTDTLSVVISSACSLSYGDTAHSAGNGSWGTGTDANKLSITLANNSAEANIGSTNFKVVCNNKKGYSVALNAGALTGAATTDTISYVASAPSAGTSGWGVKVGDAWLSSTGTVKEESVTTASTTFSVTYGASTSTTQAADTYTGTAEYTLTAKTS